MANDGAVEDEGAATGSVGSKTDGGDRAKAGHGAEGAAGADTAGEGAAATAAEGEGEGAAAGGIEDDAVPPELAADDEPAPEDDIPQPGLKKALESYSKLFNFEHLTPEEQETEQAKLDERLQEIRERPVVETDMPHDPVEIVPDKEGIEVGPPMLTRFEKARIMGARALQLSEGAPAFIEIPESAMTSLDIAMVELDQRAIPITIRRVLPNGDFQNIPIGYFRA